MFGGQFLALKNNKNVSYKLHFPVFVAGTGAGAGIPNATWTGGGGMTVLQISKDEGAFVNMTNVPVNLGNGWYSVVLTAEEMNADVVLLNIHPATSSGANHLVKILPNGAIGLSLDEVIDTTLATPWINPTFRQLLALVGRRFKRTNEKV